MTRIGRRTAGTPRSLLALRASVALVFACLAAVTAPTIPSAHAADDPFGTPTATAAWATGVTFEQPVDLDRAATRAELLLSSPLEDGGAFVADQGPVSAGRSTLRYELAAEDGGLTPNASYLGRWRLTFADGTTVMGPATRATYRDTRFDWRTLSGSTVKIHWYVGDDAFGRRALAIAERAIASSSALLGVTESRKVDFFVYADESAFYDALGPGTRENVGGQAVPELRTLFALITPDSIDASWVESVIPHELSHLVFDTAVRNPYRYPPSWLNEGLAVYLAQGYDASDRRLVRDAVGDGTLMPLQALAAQFPTTYDQFALAYAESVSAVDYAVRTYGKPALVTLVRSYADGVSDDDALTRAFGVDLGGFQARWLDDLGAAAPTRHGPVEVAPGPIPADWEGPAPTPGADGSEAAGPTIPPGGSAGPGGVDGEGPGVGGGAGLGPIFEGLAVGALVVLGIAMIAVIVLRGRRSGAEMGAPRDDHEEPRGDGSGDGPTGTLG